MMTDTWRTVLALALLLPSHGNAADLGPVLGDWVGEGLSCSVLEYGGADRGARVREGAIRFYESECVIRDVNARGSTFRIEMLCEGEGTTWREEVTLERRGKKMFIDGDGPYVRC